MLALHKSSLEGMNDKHKCQAEAKPQQSPAGISISVKTGTQRIGNSKKTARGCRCSEQKPYINSVYAECSQCNFDDLFDCSEKSGFHYFSSSKCTLVWRN